MFSRDVSHYSRTPRTLNDAFGPYARLEPLRRKSRVPAWVWATSYGIAVALFWYGIVFVRA